MALFSWTGTSALLGCSIDGGSGDTPGRSVLVLGAGLAGLSAAYELKKQGYEVTLLEGRERVGGRVWTVREGFADGHVAEIGAVRIPDVHEHTLGYVEELGLETTPFPDGDALYYIGGMRFMHTEGEPWPLPGLNATEASAGLGDLWSEYIASAFDEFGDPRAGTFPKAGIVEKYDGQVYIDFLREKRGQRGVLAALRGRQRRRGVHDRRARLDGRRGHQTRSGDQTYPHPRRQRPAAPAPRGGGRDGQHPARSQGRAHRAGDRQRDGDGGGRGGEQKRFVADHVVCTLPFRSCATSPSARRSRTTR
jgi:hypothetical protein